MFFVSTDVHLHRWRGWGAEKENGWVQSRYERCDPSKGRHSWLLKVGTSWKQPYNPHEHLALSSKPNGIKSCTVIPDHSWPEVICISQEIGLCELMNGLRGIVCALTQIYPLVPCRKPCHQHQLLCCSQSPGSVLQDGCGVRQVYRIRKKVSVAVFFQHTLVNLANFSVPLITSLSSSGGSAMWMMTTTWTSRHLSSCSLYTLILRTCTLANPAWTGPLRLQRDSVTTRW